MKKGFFGLLLYFGVIFSVQGQSPPASGQGPTPKQGCKTIDAHCVCQNPAKDFWIKNHKWGKTNPLAGEEGVCRYRLDIDEALKKAPVRFCMSGEKVNRDPDQPQTQCQVTWTCVETCTF